MTDGSGYRQALLAPHPFWATLSPVTVKQRIEQLLSAPDSAALVQSLPPIEYAVLLKAAPDMRTVVDAVAAHFVSQFGAVDTERQDVVWQEAS